VALLEDAAHLLRRAPIDTLLCHWIGSVPFAVMALMLWTQVTHPPVNDALGVAESFAAALLFLWMNCWRSVFASRLHRQLSGAVETPWDGRRVWRLVSNQALAAATKPLMLPIALASIFPFVATVTFYRYIPVLADSEELDAPAVIGKARRLARGESFQGWILQVLIVLLGLIAFVNVAVSFIILPEIVKMLTGFESAFTRTGPNFFLNRLFLLFAVLATWLVFDPFVQAVYCLRCFRAESVETGEDLRSGLRRIRATAATAAMLLLAIVAPVARAADAVAPPELERAVHQQMQSPEYNWRIPPPETAASKTPWIVLATDRAIKAVQAALKWVGKMIDRVLRWIFGGLGISPMPMGGQAPGTALHWSIRLLIVLAAALVALVAWRALRVRRKKPGTAAAPAVVTVRLEDEALTADRLPESEWLEMAERCLAEGNLRLALRAFYLANLAWLGRQQFLTIDSGKTNREFEMELRRKARQSPEARDLFGANVRAFERVWYGLHDVAEDDAREFRRRGEEIKARLAATMAAEVAA
jgi:hypothetical protein